MVSGIKGGELPLMEVPPAQPRQHRQENQDEQNFSQAFLTAERRRQQEKISDVANGYLRDWGSELKC